MEGTQPVDARYHTFMSIDDADGLGFIVPQREYVAVATNAGFTPNPPVKFSQNGQLRVYCKDALGTNFRRSGGASSGMADGNVALEDSLANCGAKATTRMQWPGCQLSSKPILIEKNVDGHTVKITKADIAYKVAKVIEDFFKPEGFLRDETWGKDANSDWRPNDRVYFHQLILHELRHVSQGSFQPVLLVDFNSSAPPTIEGDDHFGPDLEQLAVLDSESEDLEAEPEMTIDNVK